MSCAFPKTLRLLQRHDFQQVWQEGRKKHTPHFLVVIRTRGEGTTRIGITASRKTGNAVVRNRIKRLVREFFRSHQAILVHATDISVIAKKGAARLDYAAVCSELGGLFHDVGLIRDEDS